MSESEIVEPTHAELIKEVVNGLVDEAVDTATKKKAAKTTNCRGKKKATKTAHAEVKARPKRVKAEELVYDDRGAEYADIMNPHHYLVRKEPNLSKYTKAQKKEYFAPVIDALRVLYPNADDDELLKRAERARLDFIKRQKPPRAKPDAAALERAKEEREFRKKHPMAIRSENPELNKRLADFKGKKYDERSYHNWVGKTPRTLKDEKGSPAASYFDKTFAEMTGTLGLIPRYRKELATKKTAEIAYPKSKGYRVEAYDMDEDELTPENVLIYDKNDRLVAANGYEVLSSNPAHQLTRLKEMDYYDSHPTKSSRRDERYAEFLKRTKYYQTQILKGYALITEWIRDELAANGVTAPTRKKKNYIALNILNGGELDELACYSCNPVVFNTLVARIADLFATYYIFPHLKEELEELKDTSELLQLLKAETADVKLFLDPDEVSADTDEHMHNVDTLWRRSLFYPKVKAVILANRNVQITIEKYVNAAKNGKLGIVNPLNGVMETVSDHDGNFDLFNALLTVVCRHMMNTQYFELATYYGATRLKLPLTARSKSSPSLQGDHNEFLSDYAPTFKFKTDEESKETDASVSKGDVVCFTLTAQKLTPEIGEMAEPTGKMNENGMVGLMTKKEYDAYMKRKAAEDSEEMEEKSEANERELMGENDKPAHVEPEWNSEKREEHRMNNHANTHANTHLNNHLNYHMSKPSSAHLSKRAKARARKLEKSRAH